MAAELKTKRPKLYEADFYVWALAQADLLRARRFEALDLTNLIEEVQGLADTKLAAVLSNAAVVIEHLLKLQHSPATDPRNSWRASVREHRRRLWIESTPRLTQIPADRLPELYMRARDDAAAGMRDHGEHTAADARPRPAPTPSTRSPATGCRERRQPVRSGMPAHGHRAIGQGMHRWRAPK